MTSSQQSVSLHATEPGQGSVSSRGETYTDWSMWLKQDRNPERMSAWLRRRTSIPQISARLGFPISYSTLKTYLMRDERYRKLVERNANFSEKGKQRFDRLGLIDQDDLERRIAGDKNSDLPPTSCTILAEHYGVSQSTVMKRWNQCTSEFRKRHRSTFYPAVSTAKQTPPQRDDSTDTISDCDSELDRFQVPQTMDESARAPTLSQKDFMSNLVGEDGAPMDAQRLRDHYNVPMSHIYGTWWTCPEEWRRSHVDIFTGRSPVSHLGDHVEPIEPPQRIESTSAQCSVDMYHRHDLCHGETVDPRGDVLSYQAGPATIQYRSEGDSYDHDGSCMCLACLDDLLLYI